MVEVHRPDSLVLSLLPYAVIAAVAAVDITAGPEVGFLGLVSLGPAFAGLVGGWRRTAAIGALALAACTALAAYDGLLGSRRGTVALASVAGVTAAALVATAMRRRREEELARVRTVAEVAQRVILRQVPRDTGDLQVAVSYTSAVAEARIGGDLYEVITCPAGIRLIVGDVQGKGLGAVESAAVVLGAFREAANEEPALTAVGARIERAVEREGYEERFVTALLAEVNGRHVTLVSYGHPPPLLCHPDGSAEFTGPGHPAPPLGLAGHGADKPETYPLDLPPDAQLFFYTDGITEARDRHGAFYPLQRRAALLRAPDPKAALAALLADVLRHTHGSLQDDAAMLLVRRPARPAAQHNP
ncbi:PP2C family protein-serine/threonine phosphatase [Streptomyces sp. DSM 44917]|uniref:PP2C family protein-serine/threonine phosphatase n=1 Tax=Streptomyces boetiae TaxID=3075541 RepID=A0ABU2L5B1_9ACTN|nr:PP2C family protein-serine/threonine phosphatase [Streptomyces sp. DSM 44917]MDT0306508.1 PP2C family protein-serine/threonine phosphatase [Streptomyces sp. DSM 44917]